MKITRKFLTEAVSCDDLQYSRKADAWTFRSNFFYTHGYTADKWADKVSEALKKVVGLTFLVVDSGEAWKPFRGGASNRTSSHWYVTIQFTV